MMSPKVITEVENALGAATAIRGNAAIMVHFRPVLKSVANMGVYPPEWDRLLMEMEHDFADGLKSIKRLREAFAEQED